MVDSRFFFVILGLDSNVLNSSFSSFFFCAEASFRIFQRCPSEIADLVDILRRQNPVD